jgi:hypothetical protein
MVEHVEGAVPVGQQLEPRDAVGLAGIGPVQLQHPVRLERPDRRARLLRPVAVAPREVEASADAKLDVGIGEPPRETLRLRQRRPDLVRSGVVAALEAHAASIPFDPESSLGHVALSSARSPVRRGCWPRSCGTDPPMRRPRRALPARPRRRASFPPRAIAERLAREGLAGASRRRAATSRKRRRCRLPCAPARRRAQRFGVSSDRQELRTRPFDAKVTLRLRNCQVTPIFAARSREMAWSAPPTRTVSGPSNGAAARISTSAPGVSLSSDR